MRFGLIDTPQIRYLDGDFSGWVALRAPTTVGANYTLLLPDALPPDTRALTVDASGNMGYAELGSGGSVTSVALALPAIFNVSGSPITTSGTLTGTLATQAANRIFAGPSTGVDAAPTFRAIAYADVSGIVGSAANTLAAGDDSRFHEQNTDTGTDSDLFQVGTGGIQIKNNAGVVEFRNAGDTAHADIIVGNITFTGDTTVIESETLKIADNIIELNSNVTTGTPTENGGIRLLRGDQTPASNLWDESSTRWMAGLEGSEMPLARTYRQTFTSASLTAGLLTITHGLGTQYPTWSIVSNLGKEILPDDITFTSTTELTVELSSTSFGTISGTWRVTVCG